MLTFFGPGCAWFKQWARAFALQAPAVEAQWLSYFCCGPHIEDGEEFVARLREPYRKLLWSLFRDYTGNASDLIHVGPEAADTPTAVCNMKRAAYLDNPWKDQPPHHLGVLSQRTRPRSVASATGRHEEEVQHQWQDVRERWLTKPAIKWFRRGGEGSFTVVPRWPRLWVSQR